MATSKYMCSNCFSRVNLDESSCPSCNYDLKSQPAGSSDSKPSTLVTFGGGPAAVPQLPGISPFNTSSIISFGNLHIDTSSPVTASFGLPTSRATVHSKVENRTHDGARYTFGNTVMPVAEPPSTVSEPNTVGRNLQKVWSSTTPIQSFRSPGNFCNTMSTPGFTDDKDDGNVIEEPVLLGLKDKIVIKKIFQRSGDNSATGVVFNWGSNECDQLCVEPTQVNEYNCTEEPVLVEALTGKGATVIGCGAQFNIAICGNGQEVYTWGCPDDGVLGRPSAASEKEHYVKVCSKLSLNCNFPVTRSRTPGLVWGLPSDCEFKIASAGELHCGVVTQTGEVYIWGSYRDSFGSIGFPNYSEIDNNIINSQDYGGVQMIPVKVPHLPGVVTDLKSGDNHTVALVYCTSDKSRRIYVWGTNQYGQLGFKPSLSAEPTLQERRAFLAPRELDLQRLDFKIFNGQRFEPHPDLDLIRSEGSILHIFTGKCTTFLLIDLRGDSMVFGMGRNASGELGCGSNEPILYTPVQLKCDPSIRWQEICGGDFYTAGLACDGSVFTWGRKTMVGQGKIVAESSENIVVPKIQPGLRQNVLCICTGSETTFAITLDGRLFSWGVNEFGELGIPSTDSEVLRPHYVEPLNFGNRPLIAIAAGSAHTVCLTYSKPLPGEEVARRLKRPLVTNIGEETEPLAKRPKMIIAAGEDCPPVRPNPARVLIMKPEYPPKENIIEEFPRKIYKRSLPIDVISVDAECSAPHNGETDSFEKGYESGEENSSSSTINPIATPSQSASAANADEDFIDDTVPHIRRPNVPPAESPSPVLTMKPHLPVDSDGKKSDHKFEEAGEVVSRSQTAKEHKIETIVAKKPRAKAKPKSKNNTTGKAAEATKKVTAMAEPANKAEVKKTVESKKTSTKRAAVEVGAAMKRLVAEPSSKAVAEPNRDRSAKKSEIATTSTMTTRRKASNSEPAEDLKVIKTDHAKAKNGATAKAKAKPKSAPKKTTLAEAKKKTGAMATRGKV